MEIENRTLLKDPKIKLKLKFNNTFIFMVSTPSQILSFNPHKLCFIPCSLQLHNHVGIEAKTEM